MNEELLSQLAEATKMEKSRVISWAASMRKRMGVAKIIKEPNVLELDEEEEEVEVADEVKRSGISPLEYNAPFLEKSALEKEEDFEDIVDQTEDLTESLAKDSSTLGENDDSEMDIDVVNVEPSKIENQSEPIEAPQKSDADLLATDLARQQGDAQSQNEQSRRSAGNPLFEPRIEVGDAKVEPKVEADFGEISIVEKASRYDHMSKELEEMKSKYDSLFKMLMVKPEPQTTQQPWDPWNPVHQQGHSRGPYNPYPINQVNPTNFYPQSLPYPPPDQGSIYPSYNNSFHPNFALPYPPSDNSLPYPPLDQGSIYPPTFHNGRQHQQTFPTLPFQPSLLPSHRLLEIISFPPQNLHQPPSTRPPFKSPQTKSKLQNPTNLQSHLNHCKTTRKFRPRRMV